MNFQNRKTFSQIPFKIYIGVLSDNRVLFDREITKKQAEGIHSIFAILIDKKNEGISDIQITHYDLGILTRGDTLSFSNESRLITDEIKKEIQFLSPGDTIYFYSVLGRFKGKEHSNSCGYAIYKISNN